MAVLRVYFGMNDLWGWVPAMRFEIDALWNGRPAAPQGVARVELTAEGNGWCVDVTARYFGDSPPQAPIGSTEGLWEHEVVELFVVARRSLTRRPIYTEIELSPHGHYLVLRFHGVRQRVAVVEPREVSVRIEGDRWRGRLALAAADLPEPPWSANAFAINGEGSRRRYFAASALPGSEPDFHQPTAFPPVV